MVQLYANGLTLDLKTQIDWKGKHRKRYSMQSRYKRARVSMLISDKIGTKKLFPETKDTV